jgi:hypothetical protein
MRILAERAHRHEPATIAKREPGLGASILTPLPGVRDERSQFVDRGAAPDRRAEIDARHRVKA